MPRIDLDSDAIHALYAVIDACDDTDESWPRVFLDDLRVIVPIIAELRAARKGGNDTPEFIVGCARAERRLI